MINRLLFVATAMALISIVMFDENFAVNLTRAFGELVDVMPPDTWELSVAGILGVLIGAAHYRGSVK
jgi:hypothetical protein